MNQTNQTIRKANVYLCGSTGIQIGPYLEQSIIEKIGDWPLGQISTTAIETQRSMETVDRPGRTGAAVGEDLSLYNARSFRNAPSFIRNAPDSAWTDVTSGAGKWWLPASIAMWLHRDRIRQAIEAASGSGPAVLAARRKLLAEKPRLQFLEEKVHVFLSAAGGSTGPAAIAHLIDEALGEAGNPLCVVILVGPTGLSGETEKLNFLHLVAALMARRSERLWIFQIDAPIAERECALKTAADLAFDLISHQKFDLVRALKDPFAINGRRFDSTFCRVNADSLQTDNLGARARAIESLAHALSS